MTLDELEAMLAKGSPDFWSRMDLIRAAMMVSSLLRVAKAAKRHLESRTDGSELQLYRALKALEGVK